MADYLEIDWDSREITIPDNMPCLGVYNDKDSNRVWFKCPVEYGAYRVADFGLHVNYVNTGSSGTEYEGDVYFIDDAEVDGDEMTFSWLVGRRAYLEEGRTAFIVCCKIVDDDNNILRELNTTVTSLPILEGLETEAQPEEDYPDYLEELSKMVDSCIQHIEVNNVEQPIVDHTVDLSIDRAYCEDETLVLSDVWDTEAIECIKVNGVAQAVEEHTVDLDVATNDALDEAKQESEEALEKLKDDTISGIIVNGETMPVNDRIAELTVQGMEGIQFATCMTDASEQTKVVSCSGVESIYTGLTICVHFYQPCRIEEAKINVNSLGAYEISLDPDGRGGSISWTINTSILFTFYANCWIPISANYCGYCACTTDADQDEKTLSSISNLIILGGTRITVLFRYGNTAEDPVLYFANMGEPFDIEGNTDWAEGEYVDFVFDGEKWIAR